MIKVKIILDQSIFTDEFPSKINSEIYSLERKPGFKRIVDIKFTESRCGCGDNDVDSSRTCYIVYEVNDDR